MKHIVKIWPEHYRDIMSRSKRVEVRVDDRNYKVGDKMLLQEYLPDAGEYTGRETTVLITHVLQDCRGIERGYVALSVTRDWLEPSGEAAE